MNELNDLIERLARRKAEQHKEQGTSDFMYEGYKSLLVEMSEHGLEKGLDVEQVMFVLKMVAGGGVESFTVKEVANALGVSEIEIIGTEKVLELEKQNLAIATTKNQKFN